MINNSATESSACSLRAYSQLCVLAMFPLLRLWPSLRSLTILHRSNTYKTIWSWGHTVNCCHNRSTQDLRQEPKLSTDRTVTMM